MGIAFCRSASGRPKIRLSRGGFEALPGDGAPLLISEAGTLPANARIIPSRVPLRGVSHPKVMPDGAAEATVVPPAVSDRVSPLR
jgi:hypothetical protein